MYNETVIEHFNRPRNAGDIRDCDAMAQVSGSSCDDMIFLYLSVANGCIRKAKAKTFGCAAAIASASMLTTMLKGKTVGEAKEITGEKIVESLGGLPEAKLNCAALAAEALAQAIEDYEQKRA